MSVYTVRLAAGSTSSSSPVTVYTAPTGLTIVVRDIVLTPSGTGNVGELFLAGVVVARYASGLAQIPNHSEIRQVLQVGEEIAVATTDPTMYYLVTGYALT